MIRIDDYTPIVGEAEISNLKYLAEKLHGKRVQMLNSTSQGGGVAEILNRMIPMFKEIGVNASWDIIKGDKDFFGVTKKFHNALHGRHENITKKDFDIFTETGKYNEDTVDLYGDIMFIHDPQPITLINKKTHDNWIWRCHIDVSNPDKKVWEFLLGYINKYKASIFSSQKFTQQLPIRQYLVAPSIDPLSNKNIELSPGTIQKVLEDYGVPNDKPIITQISRFDRLKDPIGVIEAYKLVKKYIDCRLVLAGGTASDDPEGTEVLAEIQERSKDDDNIHILLLPQDDIAVNALQRASAVILQKSLKEGFGLTVSEALWKGKPVVAGDVGGIPLQISNKYSGMLVNSVEGTAVAVRQILNHPGFAKKLGENGKEHVRKNFLITRHMKEYMLSFLSLFYDDEAFINL